MSSERQRKRGFILPDPVTGYDLLCVSLRIPNDPDYIAAFKGHLHELGKWWMWEKSMVSGDTRATDAALYWRTLLEEYLCMSDCEGNNVARDLSISTSYTAYINNLIELYDGNTSSIAPEIVYSGDGLNGNRDAALCYAAQGFVDELCTLTIEFIDDHTSLANAAAVALAMLAGILAVPSLGLSVWLVVGVGAAGLGLQIFSSITLLGQDVYEDTAARKEVSCYIYEQLKGATLTELGFENALVGHTLTGNAAAIADMMIPFMADTNTFLSFVMVVDAAFGLSKVNALLPCPCDCSYEWAFEDDDPLPHDIIHGNRGDEGGRTGKGIKGAAYTDGAQNGVRAAVQMETECTIYSVRLDIKFGHGSANNNIGVTVKAYTSGDVLINSQPASGVIQRSKNTWHSVDIALIAPDAAYIVVSVAFQNTIDPEVDNKYVYLDNVKVNP